MHVHCTAARFFYSLCCWPRDRVTLASLATSRNSDIARLQHKLATSRDSIKKEKEATCRGTGPLKSLTARQKTGRLIARGWSSTLLLMCR